MKNGFFMHYWITGASSGIGAQLSIDLAKQGHKVFASARSEEGLNKTKALAGSHQDNIDIFPLDVSSYEQTLIVYKAIIDKYEHIDCAILNAGIYLPMDLENFQASIVKKTLDVNVLGIANCVEAISGDMIKRQAGHIAIVSSVAGYGGLPSSSAYGASKAGLINFAESLRFDAQRNGMKLQVICPGFVKTPATDKNDFPMPFLVPIEKASERIQKGLNSNKFEISFPTRFSLILKFLNMLPYSFYFKLVGKTTKA